ncbi:hypothetical protein [Acinetobacter chinensis]|uniref:hypothetical protein n=1 Tax=Acinetobacter chinensis TaxID=2004650 RepID=UPI0029346DBB|nr:hypothetical protein [Acinetobacter chinensis]WOE40067.1 hypothetical protein QSG87_09085 [Acinetobacter chinensis]
MSNMIKIDSRVTGFSESPVRLIGMCFADSGQILLDRIEIFTGLPVTVEKDTTIVVTDTPELVQNWQMRFEPAKHLKQVIEIYQSAYRAGLVEFDQKLKRYNPINVLQVRKIDKNGLQQEFDSSSLNNGHIAALIAIWASHRIAKSTAVCAPTQFEDSVIDKSMLPFSI